MKIQDEFDLCFQSRGGIFNYNQIIRPEIFSNMLSHSRSMITFARETSSRPLPNAYVNLINDQSLNAVVTKFNSNYLIGINIGTILTLQSIFLRMLSFPTILCEFGDVTKENPPEKIPNAQITNLNTIINISNLFGSGTPKCQDRFQLAMILSTHAVKFLTMHEFAHVIFGHVDFKQNSANGVSLSEVFSASHKTFDLLPLVSQTLEMDADSYGAKMGVSDIHRHKENIEKLPRSLHPFFDKFETSLSLWLYAVYTMWRLFGMRVYSLSDLKNGSHPTEGIRQRIILSMIVTLVSDKGDAYTTELAKLCHKVVTDVEEAFSIISDQPINPLAFYSAFIPESNQQYDEIFKYWKIIRPQLLPYATGNLAP